MAGLGFLLYVVMGVWLTALPFARTPDRRRLGLGIVGWVMIELLCGAIAMLVWALSSVDPSGGAIFTFGENDPATAHAAIVVGITVCAGLCAVPFLQVRRYRRFRQASATGRPSTSSSRSSGSSAR